MPSSLHQKCLLLWVLLSVLLLVQRSAKLLMRLSVRLSVLVSVLLDLFHLDLLHLFIDFGCYPADKNDSNNYKQRMNKL